LTTLHGRRVLLIISGGIAAYKSLELIRRLKDDGAEVRCILTEGGAQFVTPVSVSALSGEPALSKLFSQEEEQRFGHIRLSRDADLIVIAPASANMIAKMAHGFADSLAAAVLLAASDKAVLIAPAMNCRMWQHQATQTNIATLAARGIKQVGPASGFLACGEDGAGRMSEPAEILAAIKTHFGQALPLQGKKALVTSGPTYEALDPVRFLGNRSSGKQGHALAAALAAQGADVTLVSGPTALPDPQGVKVIPIESAREMLDACETALPCEIAVCAAAVADWRPADVAEGKIKKGGATPALTLTENPDILATLAKHASLRPALAIGFAAETNDVIKHAQEKFERKGCDWIVANEVGAGKGFAREENEVTLIRKDGKGGLATQNWPPASKQDISRRLTDEIISFFKTKD
jgi:phosphopantothenoylcysteine decarboxylase/phosphopantothenate--cysteine ligase